MGEYVANLLTLSYFSLPLADPVYIEGCLHVIGWRIMLDPNGMPPGVERTQPRANSNAGLHPLDSAKRASCGVTFTQSFEAPASTYQKKLYRNFMLQGLATNIEV